MKLMTRSAATLGALLVTAGCQRQDPEAERRALDYLATAAQEDGAVRTGTGLVYTMLMPGTGPSPSATEYGRT